MAQYLGSATSMRMHLAMLIAWLPAAASLAQTLADPTRPPQGGDLSMSPSGAASSRGVLQSVMITGSTAEAIISGKVVHVGDRYDDVRVVKITEGEVVLRTTEGLQTLKLYPGIETRHMDGKLPAASTPLKQVKSK
jgi:MSHA biogenesis protein MshK